MGRNDFENYLDGKTNYLPNQTMNWQREKEEWICYANQFYTTIEKFLEKYLRDGKVKIEKKTTTLFEEQLGHYNIDMRIIKFAEQQVKLTPIGTLLIGSKGRIDMEFRTRSVRFALVDKESGGINVSVSIAGQHPKTSSKTEHRPIEWTWKIVTPPPHIRFIELNEETFFDALMSIVHG